MTQEYCDICGVEINRYGMGTTHIVEMHLARAKEEKEKNKNEDAVL